MPVYYYHDKYNMFLFKLRKPYYELSRKISTKDA